MSGVSAERLELAPEEMRELGYWVVDRVIEHLTEIDREPALRAASPEELAAALGGPVPQGPSDPREALRTLVDVALANMQRSDHPRFFARVPGPSSFAAVLGDWLATGFNVNATSWAGGSGPVTVELVALDWLAQLLGLPAGTEGVMASGGSLANLIGLLAARASVGPGVVYQCDQAHASIARGLRTTGFGEIRTLASDEDFRMPVDGLVRAIEEDRRAGLEPRIVVASAGTTNTGAVDPLEALADLCAAERIWLHVDGAYGAAAALCDAGQRALAGLERADSLVLDPHKWLFQPYDAGCVFVRRAGALAATFGMTSEYLADVTAGEGEIDLRDRTLELSRRARGLKLWLSFRTYGAEGFRAAIERGIELAEHAQRVLEADPRWEIVTPAQLGIVTFALRGAGEHEHAARAAALARDGYAAVTSTRLRGRAVLRLCTINPRTRHEEIERTLELLAAAS